MELNPDNFDSMVRNGEPWMVRRRCSAGCERRVHVDASIATQPIHARPRAAGVLPSAVVWSLQGAEAALHGGSQEGEGCVPTERCERLPREAQMRHRQLMHGADWCCAGKANFAVVDATKYRSLSMRFGVNGFPTLYFITNGTEVRKVTASHSSDALVFYATKGWQQAAAVPETTSPLGAYGAVKFYTLFYAEKLLSLHEPLAERWGIPSAVVLFGIMFVFVMGVTGGLILCAVWIGPSKPKAGGARGGSGRGAAPAAAVAAAPAGGAAAGDKKTQ